MAPRFRGGGGGVRPYILSTVHRFRAPSLPSLPPAIKSGTSIVGGLHLVSLFAPCTFLLTALLASPMIIESSACRLICQSLLFFIDMHQAQLGKKKLELAVQAAESHA